MAELVTADGQVLAADLADPIGPSLGSVVLCHPHPQYGGNRFHPLIDTLHRSLPDAGFATIRFDFRDAYGAGRAERLDVVAALDEVGSAEMPCFVVGYSFGAAVALSVDDTRIVGLAAVAVPLRESVDPRPRAVPTLLLSPRHDQFCPADRAVELTVGWTNTTVVAVESTDHFLHGRIGSIAAQVVAWLQTQVA
ncbi:MAG TPA: hypothetical protein PKV27_06295 [Ilumatobacteraceae bacterium]|nr:hypothetical protein [Ilumatobacteraceae bacterium]